MKHPFAAPLEMSAIKELNEQETQMVGGGMRPINPPTVTTLAIGEEGGSPICGPIFTTLAIGEEGGSGRPVF